MSLSDWIKKQIANLNEKVNPPQSNVYIETINKEVQEELPFEVELIEPILEEDTCVHPNDFFLENYQFPTLDLLEESIPVPIGKDKLEAQKNTIILGLRGFGFELSKIIATVGPTVTTFEITLSDPQKRAYQIVKLRDDIARLLHKSLVSIYSRSENGTIAIEVPNDFDHIVRIRESISQTSFIECNMQLPMALGRTLYNEPVVVDLATISHLLIAGSTGKGKSALLDSIILSLLFKKHPSQIKLILISTNKISFPVYEKLEKHFLMKNMGSKEPVIIDKYNAIECLNDLCIEMENRFDLFSVAQVRNWQDYNKKFLAKNIDIINGTSFTYLPSLILIIDELSDILQYSEAAEDYLIKLAQRSRLVGIHLIISTQRASAKIITSAIKENFTARIGFKVPSQSDSRILLDNDLASQITRVGEAIYQNNNTNIKIQCSFAETHEIENVVRFIGDQKGYPFVSELPFNTLDVSESIDLSKRDSLFGDCARMVVNSQSGSTSMLQRKFNLGYNRAGRIVDQLEAAGIVGPAKGSMPRAVLITTEYELDRHLEELF